VRYSIDCELRIFGFYFALLRETFFWSVFTPLKIAVNAARTGVIPAAFEFDPCGLSAGPHSVRGE
jgi:hypothetical protein